MRVVRSLLGRIARYSIELGVVRRMLEKESDVSKESDRRVESCKEFV